MTAPAKIPLDEEIKRQNKKVASWLLFYHERKREYENFREGIIHSSGPCLSDVVPGGTNITGDPTGRKGEKLAESNTKNMGRWLALVEEVECRLPYDMQVFLRLRREYRYAWGRIGWTSAVQWKLAQELRAEVETRQNLHARWNRIVDMTARLAAKKNLL